MTRDVGRSNRHWGGRTKKQYNREKNPLIMQTLPGRSPGGGFTDVFRGECGDTWRTQEGEVLARSGPAAPMGVGFKGNATKRDRKKKRQGRSDKRFL